MIRNIITFIRAFRRMKTFNGCREVSDECWNPLFIQVACDWIIGLAGTDSVDTMHVVSEAFSTVLV